MIFSAVSLQAQSKLEKAAAAQAAAQAARDRGDPIYNGNESADSLEAALRGVAYCTGNRVIVGNVAVRWSARTVRAVCRGRVFLGMTDTQARAAWGNPEKVNRTVVESGISEQWVYDDNHYLYFTRGVLTAIQN